MKAYHSVKCSTNQTEESFDCLEGSDFDLKHWRLQDAAVVHVVVAAVPVAAAVPVVAAVPAVVLVAVLVAVVPAAAAAVVVVAAVVVAAAS